MTDIQALTSSGQIEYAPNVENLVKIEFQIDDRDVEQEYLASINQNMVDSAFHFHINGMIHGQKFLQQDLQYTLQGKKIIKSIEKRIKEFQISLIRKYLSKNKKKNYDLLTDEEIISQYNFRQMPLKNEITEL